MRRLVSHHLPRGALEGAALAALVALASIAASPASARPIAPGEWNARDGRSTATGSAVRLPVPGKLGLAETARAPRELELRLEHRRCPVTVSVRLDGELVERFPAGPSPRWRKVAPNARGGRHRLTLSARPRGACDRGVLVIRRARVRERIPLGSNVIAGHLERDPQYGPFMAAHLDSVTIGNNLQWVAVEPRQGERRFRGADRVVSFAAANGLELRGHPLVWWAGLPAWLLNGSWSRDELIAIMRERIHAVVGRYRGQITAWDVVNEAIDADGSYRPSLWMDVIGPEYLDLAFRFAHEADPDARLFYNEYDAEVANPRSDAMFELVSGMLARDVPIDGVGFQTHLFGEHPDAAAIAANFERFAALGLELEITEMDVPDYSEAPGAAERRELQADAYRIVGSVCRREPACQRLTTWGLTDRYTWLGTETRPLPFDEALQPKPAWESLRAELRPPRK